MSIFYCFTALIILICTCYSQQGPGLPELSSQVFGVDGVLCDSCGAVVKDTMFLKEHKKHFCGRLGDQLLKKWILSKFLS